MRDENLEKKLMDAIKVAKLLFDRGKATGTTGNLSFLYGDRIYITASGTCFGMLDIGDFAVLTRDGAYVSGAKPSKEWPLHLDFYKAKTKVGAVIHVHSRYATLFSCLEHETMHDVVPEYTPYLKMKVGSIGCVPYTPPGTEALFSGFRDAVEKDDGFLLKNHGLLIGAKDIMQGFFAVEEVEESLFIAYEGRRNLEIEPIVIKNDVTSKS